MKITLPYPSIENKTHQIPPKDDPAFGTLIHLIDGVPSMHVHSHGP
ncbi:MAG: hypothetical protein ACSNEK_06350 [Parachlamydiaceae bacterium]